MQQFIDYIAILAFVVVYFMTKDIFLATGVLMVAVTVQICLYWLMKKPIGNELKLTFWASMILGGMTLIFQDETFIKWKPSIINWLLALVLVGAHLFAKTFLVEKMLGKVLRLPDSAWRSLTYGWALAFTISGTVNIYVAYSYSLDTWVTFKFVGLLGLNLVFLMATFAFLHFKGLLTEEHLLDPNNSDSLDDAVETKTER
ncbi:MAG: septation protein IspZ [Pseudomonadales bacterium]|jgi:intracellular septation protein|nr:septation protein IspZ [Pseudomonadales bacterium]